jgi:hypothetical protein
MTKKFEGTIILDSYETILFNIGKNRYGRNDANDGAKNQLNIFIRWRSMLPEDYEPTAEDIIYVLSSLNDKLGIYMSARDLQRILCEDKILDEPGTTSLDKWIKWSLGEYSFYQVREGTRVDGKFVPTRVYVKYDCDAQIPGLVLKKWFDQIITCETDAPSGVCEKCKKAQESAEAEWDDGGSPPSLPAKCSHRSDVCECGATVPVGQVCSKCDGHGNSQRTRNE